MNQIVTSLLSVQGPAVYAVITVLVLLEAAAFVGLIIPGETALLVGGVLASRGNVSLTLLLPLVSVAAVGGDSLGYAIGRRFGPRIESSRAGQWIGDERWTRVHAYVEHRGAWAVVIGRWVGVLRALVPAVAGLTRMPYRRFLIANISGGLIWVALVTGLGYLAGGAVSTAQGTLGRLSIVGTVLMVLLVAVATLEARRQRATPNSTTPSTKTSRGSDPTPATSHPHPTSGQDAHPTPTPGTAWRASRWWLPAGVAAAATLAAAELLDAVREQADLAAYDTLVTSGVVAERQPPLTVIAQAATSLGSTISIGALTLLVLAWTGWQKRWRITGFVAVAMATSAALTLGLKHAVGRTRPPASLVLGPLDTGYAFPSGHTLNTTVLFGLLAAIALRSLHSTLARAGVVLAWLTISTAVGLSRIYLGYHWLTDVLAGWSIGLAVLSLTALGWAVFARRLPADALRQPAVCGSA